MHIFVNASVNKHLWGLAVKTLLPMQSTQVPSRARELRSHTHTHDNFVYMDISLGSYRETRSIGLAHLNFSRYCQTAIHCTNFHKQVTTNTVKTRDSMKKIYMDIHIQNKGSMSKIHK